MKKTSVFLTGGLLLTVCFIVSCKSAPAAQPQTAQAPAQNEAANREDLVDYASLAAVIAQAREKRQELVDNQLEASNVPLVEKADGSLRNAEDLFRRGDDKLTNADRNAAFKNAQFALISYSGIVDQHWLDTAAEARNKSLAAQQEALKLKADVAVREDYNLTTGIHNQGETAYRTKEYKKAVNFYVESASLYQTVATAAAEKRRLATLALQSAEAKISESEKIAADAESVLSVSADVSGEQL
ncbi:MAG: hypothetical protein LBD22_04720 [Spirochaetaceae bacterium]|nr:hypothetical protein [Spirochaetaceae bacterium]